MLSTGETRNATTAVLEANAFLCTKVMQELSVMTGSCKYMAKQNILQTLGCRHILSTNPSFTSGDKEARAGEIRKVKDRLLDSFLRQDEFYRSWRRFASVEQLCMQCTFHQPILTCSKLLQNLFYMKVMEFSGHPR